jgi:hypothetical protein
MIEGNIVKVRFRKNYMEQTSWVFIGKVLKFTENWVALEGKGLIVSKGKVVPVTVDEESRIVMVPRDNIAHIRILPDEFNVNQIEVKIVGLRIYVGVPGGPDTSISEV